VLLSVYDKQLLNRVDLHLAQLLQLVGHFVDELPRELLLVRLQRRVEEEDALDLRDRQLAAHVADALDVGVGLARLQQLARLDDRLERLERARVMQLAVAQPLLEMADVEAQLDALRPVTHLLAQYQIVERVRSDEVEQLKLNIKSFKMTSFERDMFFFL